MMKLQAFLISLFGACSLLCGQELSDSLKASYSIPKGRVKEIVSNAAKDFGRRHAKDYVSLAKYERTVRSGNVYCQLFISEGLFGAFNFNQDNAARPWEDSNMGRFYPLNSFMSLFRIPGTEEYSKTISLNNQEAKGLDAFIVNYCQYPELSPVARMRAMEIFGPLNYKKLKFYDFDLVNYSPEGEIYTVHFASKADAFPKKIRLCGEGLLFISRKQGLLGFKITNIEDRFTSYFYNASTTRMESVTPYTIEVRYKLEQGRIIPDHLVQEVRWKTPQDENRKAYFRAEISPYRNPFANSLVSSSRVVFYNAMILNQQDAGKLSGSFSPSYTGWRPCTLENDPAFPMPDPQKVKDSGKIRKDLEAVGVRLEDQTPVQRELYEDYCNSIDSESGRSSLDKDKERLRAARKIYSILFKTGPV